jgi:8-oxo-dGTP pyrophosphatase MutT (NUDIX family)
MTTELSAGGVVVRRLGNEFEFAVIQPPGKDIWMLPKGHVDKTETSERAAEREVEEETGLQVRLLQPLGDIQYVYQFRGARVFKKVSFFLFEQIGGKIDQLLPAMRVEVQRARWAPLGEADKILAYPGERDMAAKALGFLTREPTPPASKPPGTRSGQGGP